MLDIALKAVLFGGAVEISLLDSIVRLIPSHGLRLALVLVLAGLGQNVLSGILSYFGLSSEHAKIVTKIGFKGDGFRLPKFNVNIPSVLLSLFTAAWLSTVLYGFYQFFYGTREDSSIEIWIFLIGFLAAVVMEEVRWKYSIYNWAFYIPMITTCIGLVAIFVGAHYACHTGIGHLGKTTFICPGEMLPLGFLILLPILVEVRHVTQCRQATRLKHGL